MEAPISEIQTTNWDSTAASNNATPPDGWPEGQAPSTVNDCAREMMAAVKRWFTRATGLTDAGVLVSSGGTSTAITVTYDVAPASLYTGLECSWKVTTTCGAAPTLNVNSLGAKNIQKIVGTTYTDLAASDIVATQHVTTKYDATLDKWVIREPMNTLGKKKLWVPVTSMVAQAASGPASANVAATDIQYAVFDFDQAAAEIAHFNISMPSSWNEGTVTFVPVWTAAAGTGDVVWTLNGVARSNDDAIAASYSGSVSSTDTLIATNDLHRGPESGALTIDGTPAANDTVFFRLFRNATVGGDTLNADARLIGIELYFTTDQGVDVAT
jgi:hypothetical protein